MGRRRSPIDDRAVLDSAIALVDRDGIDALTLAAVAGRLGVTQPALYRHIGGFDDLLARLALAGRRELLARVNDAAVGRAGVDAVRLVAGAWRAFAAEHPGLYAATDRSPLAGDEENEAAAAAIVNVLTRVIEGFGLGPVEAQHAAWAMRSALHGFASLELASGNPESLDLDATYQRLVSLFVAGLENWGDLEKGDDRARRKTSRSRARQG
jgi:AcrR family transcriptional regulator